MAALLIFLKHFKFNVQRFGIIAELGAVAVIEKIF